MTFKTSPSKNAIARWLTAEIMMPPSAYRECDYRSADGLRLYYRLYDSAAAGIPVVCLPGLTRNCRDFEPLALHLRQRGPVLTPDLRGRGRSEYDPEWRHYHPATYVGDCLRLLEASGCARVALIGTSLGGLVGMMLAAQYAARIAALVLVDIGPELAPAGVARILSYAGKLPPVSSWTEARRQAQQVHGIALPNYDAAQWMQFARQSYRETAPGQLTIDADPQIGRALAEGAGEPVDTWAAFDAITQPLTVLHGESSDILDRAILDKMQQRKPGMRRVTVPGYGHISQITDAPPARAAIDELLSQLDGGV